MKTGNQYLIGFGWLVYSCCSHLEHRASVKRSVSLQFLNLRHSVELLGRVISPSQGRYLTQTSIPRVGFKPTIPAFEQAKTVHSLDRTATVIGSIQQPWYYVKVQRISIHRLMNRLKQVSLLNQKKKGI
jgi:hypothetical protein